MSIVEDRLTEIVSMVEDDKRLWDIADRTCQFLDGKWDDFSLELLSSVDFIMTCYPHASVDEVYNRLCAWSPRKKQLFSDKSLTEDVYRYLKN